METNKQTIIHSKTDVFKNAKFKGVYVSGKPKKDEKKVIKNLNMLRKDQLLRVRSSFDKRHNSFEIRNWSVWFGKKTVLTNINADIQKKKVTALIGENGSGKTTLLRSLNRMNTIIYNNVTMSGDIYFYNGTNLYSPNISQVELTTRVGTISQKPTPFPMSIYDNIAYGPRNHGVLNKAALDKIVKQSLDYVALWDEVKDKLNDFATDLSGGQQQRLCIARAIALKPEVLLMDQPTSGLDPIATAAIENLILKLKKDFTIVLVTHSLTQVQRVSDNTIFLKKGKLIEQGPTRQMFTTPKHRETIDYILGK